MLLVRLRACLADFYSFFFFNDTATTEIYTLSLHDALPIWHSGGVERRVDAVTDPMRPILANGRGHHGLTLPGQFVTMLRAKDRKSTRLNSSHANISYAVFCLKKKKKKNNNYMSQPDTEIPL